MLLLEVCRVRVVGLGLGLARVAVAVLEGLGLLFGDGLPCLYTRVPLPEPLPTLWVRCCAARTPRELVFVLLSALSKLLTLALPLLATLYGMALLVFLLTGAGRVPNRGDDGRLCPFWELLASIHAFLALVRLG